MQGSKEEIEEKIEERGGIKGDSRYLLLSTRKEEDSVTTKMFADEYILDVLTKNHGEICWLIKIDSSRNFCHSHDREEILDFLLSYFDSSKLRLGLSQVSEEYLGCLALIEDETHVTVPGDLLGIKFDITFIFNDSAIAEFISKGLTNYWSQLYYDLNGKL